MTGKTTLRFTGTLNPGQVSFVRSQAEWTAFLGGWGSGKTWIGARKAVELAGANPGTAGLIVAPFWNTVYRTTLRAFLAALPRHLVRKWSRKERCVYLVGGRSVYYGSADRPETLDGATVAWVWMDEGRYVKRDGWRVTMSRLRDGRAKRPRGIVTSTPGGPWLRDEFGGDKDPKARLAVHASTRENARNLREGVIASMESSLSARSARVFIEGEFGLLEGAVYEEFDPAYHVIPWKYDRTLRTVATVDFGFNRPAVVFLQQAPPGWRPPPTKKGLRMAGPGSWVAFDELVPDRISTEALGMQIRAKGYHLSTVYCDPAGDGTQPALGITDVQVLGRVLGIAPRYVLEPRFRYIPFGVGVVQAMLRDANGATRLWFAEGLRKPAAQGGPVAQKARRGVLVDIEGYAYPEAKDGRPVGDHPLKDGLTDHTMDAVRYFGINEMLAGGLGSGITETQYR